MKKYLGHKTFSSVLSFALVFILLLQPVCSTNRAPLDTVIPALSEFTKKAMSDWGVPGAAIAIVKDGKIVHVECFGVKQVGTHEKIDENTVFSLASVTKNLTDTLIMQLVDEGLLHLEDKVTQYLPDFSLNNPEVTKEFTIRDLLSHRSGLPGFAGDTLIELGWAAPEMFRALKLIPFENTFRHSYAYQNIFVGISGLIIEKVTGQPLSEVYRNHLFNPLGLKNTTIGKLDRNSGSFFGNISGKIKGLFSSSSDNVSKVHDKFAGKTRLLPHGNPAYYTFPATSGINMSIADAAQWLLFQLNNGNVNGKQLVSLENLNQMRTSHVDVGAPQGGRQFPKERVTQIQYGMGWFIHDYMDTKMLSHMGGMTGTRGLLSLIPDEKIGIIIIANLGGMRVSLFPEAIRAKFFDLYLNLPDQQDWSSRLLEEMNAPREKHQREKQLFRLKNPSPREKSEFYDGVYENVLYGKVTVSHDDKNMYLTYNKTGTKAVLEHWNGDSFNFSASSLSPGTAGTDQGEITFGTDHTNPNKAGILKINLFFEGEDSTFKRVS